MASSCRVARDGDRDDLVELNRRAEVSIVPPSIRAGQPRDGPADARPGRDLGLVGGAASRRLTDPPPEEREPWHHPIVFGWLGALAGGEPDEVLTAYLHQAALGMIGAGVRAIPVGHTHGQQVLAYLHDDIRELAAARRRDPETAGCPFYEVLCDEQTHLYARMFRS